LTELILFNIDSKKKQLTCPTSNNNNIFVPAGIVNLPPPSHRRDVSSDCVPWYFRNITITSRLLFINFFIIVIFVRTARSVALGHRRFLFLFFSKLFFAAAGDGNPSIVVTIIIANDCCMLSQHIKYAAITAAAAASWCSLSNGSETCCDNRAAAAT